MVIWTPRSGAVLISVLLMSSASSAQRRRRDPDEREYRSIARIQNDHPEDALTRYTALHSRNQSPRALAQIAGVEAQMGRWVAAEEHLRAAMSQQAHPWISRNRAALEQMRTRILEHVSELMVVSNVPGASLQVNGASAVALPLQEPLRVLVGSVVVDLRAEGHEPLRETLRTTPGRTRVELTLVPRAAVVATPPPAPEIPAVRPPPPAPRPAPPAVTVATTAPTNPPRTAATLGYVGLGAGALGLGVGVLGVVLRNAQVDRFINDNCAVRGGVVQGGGSCQSTYDAGGGMEAMATAGFVTGGVFLLAGVTALLLAPRAHRDERATPARVSVHCGWGPGDLGAACGGSF